MIVCPKCNTLYADHTLSFCLEDGTPLAAARQADTPTQVLTETELVTSFRPGGTTPDPRFMDSQVTSVGSLDPPPMAQRSGQKTIVTVVLTTVVLLSVLGGIGIAVFIFIIRPGGQATSNLTPNKNGPAILINTNTSPTATPSPSPSATALASNVSTPTVNPTVPPTPPPADNSTAKSEVTQLVSTWKSQLEGHDINAYMANYADKVVYYSGNEYERSFIRSQKERALGMYHSIRVTVSNMDVTVSPEGDKATAVFDKEWVFEGKGRSNEGKTLAQLDFKKINGKWLITTEKDQKEYYSR